MDRFEASWSRAWPGCGAAAAGADVHARLLARYEEPHRAYHTLQHLGECLACFAESAALAENPAEVEMALWFHDAIYDVRASDNEARSAAWATAALRQGGAPDAAAARVQALVMATRHTAVPIGADEQLLVDIDLAILGAGEERFAQYEQQIRREYAHVPGFIFRPKRRAILRTFVERARIYSTGFFHERLEQAARRNLQRAIAAG